MHKNVREKINYINEAKCPSPGSFGVDASAVAEVGWFKFATGLLTGCWRYWGSFQKAFFTFIFFLD